MKFTQYDLGPFALQHYNFKVKIILLEHNLKVKRSLYEVYLASSGEAFFDNFSFTNENLKKPIAYHKV